MHTVYEYVTAEGVSLYVGATKCLYTRTQAHKGRSPWFKDADHLRVRHFATAEEADDAEYRLIVGNKPLHNKKARRGDYWDTLTPAILPTATVRCIRVVEVDEPLPIVAG